MSARDFVFDRVTTGIAAGATASPIWLPQLEEISKAAATLLPILGVVWLLMQMMAWLFKKPPK